MIVRIVQLTFQEDKIEDFKSLFEARKEKIRHFDGCQALSLLQGIDKQQNVFVTYSNWESEQHLNNYRHSELFKETWVLTKAMFADKPKAISLTKEVELS